MIEEVTLSHVSHAVSQQIDKMHSELNYPPKTWTFGLQSEHMIY